MKKLLTVTIVLVMLLSTLTVFANEEIVPIKKEDIKPQKTVAAVFKLGVGNYGIDGKEVKDVAPYISSGRTMLPLRYLAYSLGISDDNIVWQSDTRSIWLMRDNKLIQMTIDDSNVLVGDIVTGETKTIKIDAPPEVKAGRTCLPLRALAEIFGLEVEWNNEHKAAIIYR